MTAEKSSSTKKTAKKAVESEKLETQNEPLSGDENKKCEELRTDEQIAIEDLQHQVFELSNSISTLMSAISKFAVLTGQGNHLKEFGLSRWEPGKQDMSRYDS